MTKNSLDQRAGDNSNNIQVHGNLIIGISSEEARRIAIEIFNENFLKLQSEASAIAQKRVDELMASFFDKLAVQQDTLNMDVFKTPDMQYVLFGAQRDYARHGNKGLADLLVDLLVKRVQVDSDELKKIVLNEALLVAPKITIKQLNAISIRFLIAYSRSMLINNIETFNNYLTTQILPFCTDLATAPSDYQHIEYAGCGSVGVLQNDISNLLKSNYSGVLSKGFDKVIIEQLQLNSDQYTRLITCCLRNPTKLQVSAINDEVIDSEGKKYGLNEEKIKQLKDLQNANLFSKEDIEQQLLNIDVKFSDLFRIWDNIGLGKLQLTTVGIALAHANIKKTIQEDFDLGIWIK